MAGTKKIESSLGKRKALSNEVVDATSSKKQKMEVAPAGASKGRKRKYAPATKVSTTHDNGGPTKKKERDPFVTPTKEPPTSLHDMVMGGLAMMEQTDARSWPYNSQAQLAEKSSRRVSKKGALAMDEDVQEDEDVEEGDEEEVDEGLGSDSGEAQLEKGTGANKRKAEDAVGEESPNKRAKTPEHESEIEDKGMTVT